jgi:hypothetical protein
VEHFKEKDQKTWRVGVVSRDRVPPDQTALVELPFDAWVWLEVEFSEPAYAYLLACNAAGQEEQLWPADAQNKRDPAQEPPLVRRIRYPDGRGPEGGPLLMRLDDEPRGGLQAFAVVLSRRPLPCFAEWQKARGPLPWRRESGWQNVWQADEEGVFPVQQGQGVLRGGVAAPRVPPLLPLCESLRQGADVEWVEVLAVPVLPK